MPKITGIELTEQEARDILTTAIEGNGIGYWANDYGPVEIWRDDKTLDIYRIKLDAENEEGVVDVFEIDTAKIKQAVVKIVTTDTAPDLITDIVEDDIDAWGADIIIQVACFGKVIYG